MEYIVQRKGSSIVKNLRVSFMCVSVYTWPLNNMGVIYMGVNAHPNLHGGKCTQNL